MLPDSTVVGGIVRLDTGMKCRASDFSMANFHRLILDGALYIDDFTFDSPGYGVSCYTRHSEVKLGTSGSFVTANNVKVDSLLTLSMSTDTISAIVDGMTIRLKNAKAGAGCLQPSALGRQYGSDTFRWYAEGRYSKLCGYRFVKDESGRYRGTLCIASL